jgi:hypothetical protein
MQTAAASLVLVVLFAGVAVAQGSRQKAWQMLETGAAAKGTAERATAVRVLGLIQNDVQAVDLAEKALQDQESAVRAAAATALGQMGSKRSIPKLKEALKDQTVEVVMAAAHALRALGDATAYEVYYAVLTGERKSGAGLVEQQKQMLKDPKRMAQFGFEQGLGQIPFASIGYGVVKAVRRDDTSPVRAGAAKVLASDPDPRSGQALAEAAADKSWIVRAAALDAIARRGDVGLLAAAESRMTDENDAVRYTAAAAVVRLASSPQGAAR